jgi:hypothetical protein
MKSKAGLLYLSKSTERILLILENCLWTVPTFARTNGLIADAEELLCQYSRGKIIPIELYLSKDQGFEYGTYICLVDDEFLTRAVNTICWATLADLPKQLHSGLKATLNNSIIRTKIDTVLALENHPVL